jgi:hypothetical protein
MKRIESFALVIALLSSFAMIACGGEETSGETFSQKEAMAAWDGTEDVVLTAQEKLAEELTKFGDAPGSTKAITGTLKSFVVDFTIDNPKGAGSAHVTGTGGIKGDDYVVDLAIAITDWDVEDITAGLVDTIATDTGKPITVNLTVDKVWPLSELVTSLTVDGEVLGTKQTKLGPIVVPMPVEAQISVQGRSIATCGMILIFPLPGGACPAS